MGKPVLKVKRISLRIVIALIISLVYVGTTFTIAVLIFRSSKNTGLSFPGSLAVVLAIAIFLKPAEILLNWYFDRKFFGGAAHELSKQKKFLETELENRERMKSVGILAAGVAHEVKNPLAAIYTFTEYLPTKYEDPEFRTKFIRIVQNEVKRITGIVQSLLVFSKPTARNPRIFDVNEVIQEIIDLESSEMVAKKIETEHVQNAPKVLADPGQIKQALLNLIMNAMDAMKKNGGKLSVRTKPSKYGVEITVEDTGCGIPPEKLSHIFDPFYSDKDKGTGLGLAVTHSIIQNNGGRISVISEVGKGTKFTISLPKAKEAAFYLGQNQ